VILVDTSVWVDHLRQIDGGLQTLLNAGSVLTHPLVVGEIAMGSLRQRKVVLHSLSNLPQAIVATHAEVLHFVDRHGLFGRGIGFADAHLLAAARLTAGSTLWTRDRRLHAVAQQLGLATTP
jgi:predicted nucleic acid-binding protein